MAPLIVQQMARTIRALKAQGVSVLLSEQNLPFAEAWADRAYLYRTGPGGPRRQHGRRGGQPDHRGHLRLASPWEYGLDVVAIRVQHECKRSSRGGVVAQMPVAADVGSGDERDELGSG